MILYTNNMHPKRIYINEEQLQKLNEDVYTQSLDNNNKKAKITYQKGVDSSVKDVINSGEGLKTDKMDSMNSDTYIVPLKNGINSYNITSIDGKEIMHYFKRHFSNQATKMMVDFGKSKEEYELEMENREIRDFLRQFAEKVTFVIEDYVSKHKELTNRKIYKLSQVCVYPVKSSSNFNSKIVDLLLNYKQSIYGLPVLKLNENLLKKDISNIQKDEDFIAKNIDYYNRDRTSSYKQMNGRDTHMNALNTDLNMLQARNKVNNEVNALNEIVRILLTKLYSYRHNINIGNEKAAQNDAVRIANLFPDYCRRSSEDRVIMQYSYYVDDRTGESYHKNNKAYNKEKGESEYTHFKQKKSTKMPSVDENTKEIIEITKNYNPQGYNSLKPQELRMVRVMYREIIDFQIKKLFNDTRMGLKNLFGFDEKELEIAKKQIEGNILVIFDDNISGGATLSDICAQFMNVGVKHIIPITFGKMFEQWGGRGRGGMVNVAKPRNGFVFADNKTFIFDGERFNTQNITNPMDAANAYTNTFGRYNKQGAAELWKMVQKIKKGG